MTSLLYTPPGKTHCFDVSVLTPKASKAKTKIQISKDISESCTKPLLISVIKMNQNITRFITDGLTSYDLDGKD